MKTKLFALALLVPISASAMQVGTNQVEFVLVNSGYSNAVREVILDEVSRIVAPSLSFCSCEDLGDGYGLFEGVVSPRTLERPGLFTAGIWTNGTFVVPIANSFADEINSKISFFIETTNEIVAADAFRLNLVQAFSETNGIAFIATNFVSKKFGSNSIPLDTATNIWTSWKSWSPHPIPRSCFIRRDVGPGGTNYLWAFIPMQTSSSVFWLPIIYVDDRWNISMWDYEEQGYSWE